MALLFVYGTLKRGFPNHWRMLDAQFVGRARVRGALADLRFFPGLDRTGDGMVHGEVYEVDAAHMEALDNFEGVPNLYRREQVKLRVGHVAVYVATEDTLGWSLGVIPGGCWTRGQENNEDDNHGS